MSFQTALIANNRSHPAAAAAASPLSPGSSFSYADTDADMRQTRLQYEQQLADGAADDPLDQWSAYIGWIRQTYPGCHTTPQIGGLASVLERCCFAFQRDERYRSDVRFLRIWMSFAEICNNAPDVFAYLLQNRIGTQHALLYESWASAFEKQLAFASARQVYEAAIANNAMPIDRLKRSFASFQRRVVINNANAMDAPSMPVKPVAVQTGVVFDGFKSLQSPAPTISVKTMQDQPIKSTTSWAGQQLVGSPVSAPAATKASFSVWEDPELAALPEQRSDVAGSAAQRVDGHKARRTSESQRIGQAPIPSSQAATPRDTDGSGYYFSFALSTLVDAQGKEMQVEEVRARHQAARRMALQAEQQRLLQVAQQEAEARQATAALQMEAAAQHLPSTESQIQTPLALPEIALLKIDDESQQQSSSATEPGELMVASSVTSLAPSPMAPSPAPARMTPSPLPIAAMPVSAVLDENQQDSTPTSPLARPSPVRVLASHVFDMAEPAAVGTISSGHSVSPVRVSSGSESSFARVHSGSFSVSQPSTPIAPASKREFASPVVTPVMAIATALPRELEPLRVVAPRISPSREALAPLDYLFVQPSAQQSTPAEEELVVECEQPLLTSEQVLEELEKSILAQDFVVFEQTADVAEPPAAAAAAATAAATAAAANPIPPSEAPLLDFGLDDEVAPMGLDDDVLPTAARHAPARRLSVTPEFRCNFTSTMTMNLPMPLAPVCEDAAEYGDENADSTNSQSAQQPSAPVESRPINPFQADIIDECIGRAVEMLREADPLFISMPETEELPAALSSPKTATNAVVTLPFPDSATGEMQPRVFRINRPLGEGIYGQVYLASDESANEEERLPPVALKVEKPATPWEYYVCTELGRRLNELDLATASRLFVGACATHLFSTASVTSMDYFPHSSLLDAINMYARVKKSMDEVLVVFYAIELFKMLECMHASGIVHADIKPDNLMIRDEESGECTSEEDWDSTWHQDGSAGWASKGLALIDFGRSIDLLMLPEDVQFCGSSNTESFLCVEMQKGTPWKYQVDTYAVLCTIHVMLHNTYMEVVQDPTTKRWKPRVNFKRYWQAEMWSEIFDTLLNPADPIALPDIASLRAKLEAYLQENPAKSKLIKSLLIKLISQLAGR